MKRFLIPFAAALSLAFGATVPAAPPNEPGPKRVYATGAKPSPAKVLATAPRFQKNGKIGAPAQFAAVPTRLSMWGNDRYGCCVTTEACFAKIADNPNVFITEQTCIDWAARHGVLNGATLDEVLDAMHRDGITAEDGKIYKEGPKLLVDLSDKAALEAAIYQGRVKIAVASGQVMDAVNGTSGQSGWFGVNWRRDPRTDHCTSLLGYGPASFCYDALKLPLPAGVDPGTYGYLMFTWNSLGFVSRDSLLAVTAEAWVRQPTTDGYPKPEPTPAPTPMPTPEPMPVPPTIPVWVFVVAGGMVLVLIGGIVFVGRESVTR